MGSHRMTGVVITERASNSKMMITFSPLPGLVYIRSDLSFQQLLHIWLYLGCLRLRLIVLRLCVMVRFKRSFQYLSVVIEIDRSFQRWKSVTYEPTKAAEDHISTSLWDARWNASNYFPKFIQIPLYDAATALYPQYRAYFKHFCCNVSA